jgi:hypothetical protein
MGTVLLGLRMNYFLIFLEEGGHRVIIIMTLLHQLVDVFSTQLIVHEISMSVI